MLLRSLQQLPGENHSIPIISPTSAVAAPADMTVPERQIARLHWQQQQQQQQPQPQSQQQQSYLAAETIATDSPLVLTPYTLPRAPRILPPTGVGVHSTNLCGEQGMIGHDLPSGSACVWQDLTHYPFLCDSGPGEVALGGGGGAVSRTFSCPPLVGSVESRGRPSLQGFQLDHASAAEDSAAAAPAVAALSTDGARDQSSKKRKSAERASTYKVKVEGERALKKMTIKAEGPETLVEPKMDSPSSTLITSNNHNTTNNREASSSASKEKKMKKAPEPPPKTDYIHVRARRGQATDSHSLAERVRREKISERMKLLQDLVPGCNKITGKAGMLDEIINYVQSLQRQVEFLSMKLAAVTPALDFNLDALIAKEMSSLAGGCGIPAQMGLLTELFGLPFLQINSLQEQALSAECCSLPLSMVSSCSPAEEALCGVAAAQVPAPPASCSFPGSCNVLVNPPPPSTASSGWDEGELQGFYTLEEFERGRPAASGPVDAPSSTFQALISPR